jgi:hypothetical protein
VVIAGLVQQVQAILKKCGKEVITEHIPAVLYSMAVTFTRSGCEAKCGPFTSGMSHLIPTQNSLSIFNPKTTENNKS